MLFSFEVFHSACVLKTGLETIEKNKIQFQLAAWNILAIIFFLKGRIKRANTKSEISSQPEAETEKRKERKREGGGRERERKKKEREKKRKMSKEKRMASWGG